MEFMNSELVNAQQALMGLEKLPLKVSWAVAQLIVKLDGPMKAFAIARDSLTRKYEIEMEPQADGGLLIKSKKDGNAQRYASDLNELLTMTTEIEVAKVRLPNTIKVEPSALVALRKFVEV